MSLCQHMCRSGFEGFTFFYNKSMYIMPRILCTLTCALRGVGWQKLAGSYSRSGTDGMLYLYFLCKGSRIERWRTDPQQCEAQI